MIIETQNVKYNYTASEDINLALSDINIQIKKGEFVCIIGHNGSGKSTLAKLFNAFFLPTSGDVTVNEMNTKDEQHLFDIRKTCGMVFQNPDNQLVASLVEDDVAFGPENIGLPPEEIRKRVDFALDAVNMREFLSSTPNMLSGGQKQRVAIAGVLALKPDIIVFDEPTAMLDPAGRREVMNTIRSLNKNEGKTIILITHHMEEAAEADRVIVLSNGEVFLDGTPENVFSQTEKLKACKLLPPVAAQVYDRLKNYGLGDAPLNIYELADKLCLLLKQ
jgi:energy-coupling factor transport system ATP-binding protein